MYKKPLNQIQYCWVLLGHEGGCWSYLGMQVVGVEAKVQWDAGISNFWLFWIWPNKPKNTQAGWSDRSFGPGHEHSFAGLGGSPWKCWSWGPNILAWPKSVLEYLFLIFVACLWSITFWGCNRPWTWRRSSFGSQPDLGGKDCWLQKGRWPL